MPVHWKAFSKFLNNENYCEHDHDDNKVGSYNAFVWFKQNKKKKKKKTDGEILLLLYYKNHLIATVDRNKGIELAVTCTCMADNWYDVEYDIIQLLTCVEVDMKCYWTINCILANVKRKSVWIVYCSITLHVHRNKSQHLFYYIKIYFSWKVIYPKFWLTFLHKPCDITTLRHSLCDISWSGITIHATLGFYVTNHSTLYNYWLLLRWSWSVIEQ